MFKAAKKRIQKTTATATIIAILFFVVLGCVAPETVNMDIQDIRSDMGQLQKMVEQKANNTVVVKYVDQINSKTKQTTQFVEELSILKKNGQIETIGYSEARWIIVGISLIAIIFVIMGLLLVRTVIERGNMLSILTRAVQKSGKDTVVKIKQNLKKCVHEGYHYNRDIENLAYFTRKAGTFAEQKPHREV